MKQDKQPVTKAQLEWLQKQNFFCYSKLVLLGGIVYESYMRSVIRMIHTSNMNGIVIHLSLIILVLLQTKVWLLEQETILLHIF